MIEEQLILMEKYKLTSDELLFITVLLLLQDNEDYVFISHYLNLPSECRNGIRDNLISLQNKGIILKSYKVPNIGEKFIPEDVELNKNFVKNYYKSSFNIGKELFEAYPMFGLINGEPVGIRGVSKKFDSLEDFYKYYGKSIQWNPKIHEHIIELVNWGKENNLINCSLCNFVIDRKWDTLEAMKEGDVGTVNINAIKLV